MPFKSTKQKKFLYSQKPEVAKKFAKHGVKGAINSAMYGKKKLQSMTKVKKG